MTDTNITTVTGGSDDLIEFDGHIYEEFCFVNGAARLVFDNGVVLDMEYDRDSDGIWRIAVVEGHDLVTVTPCPDPTGETVYTDSAEVRGASKVVGTRPDGTNKQKARA